MTRRADPRTSRLLLLARTGLAWERLRPSLVPLGALGSLFLAAAFLDLLPGLPWWGHAAVLAAFAGAATGMLWHLRRRYALPVDDDAKRRLERDSGLDHRPLATLDDTLSFGCDDPRTMALWRMHRRRARASLGRLRVAWPRTDMARHDPLALRVLPLLLLAAGLVAGYGDYGPRLGRALLPEIAHAGTGTSRIDLWIVPPEYTGQTSWHFRAGRRDPVEVPEGSDLRLHVVVPEAPGISLGDDALALESLGAGSYRAESRIVRPGALTVIAGTTPLATWSLQVIPDRAPHAAFVGQPHGNDAGRLGISYRAGDDYGLVALDLQVLAPGQDAPILDLALPLPAPGGTPGRIVQDFSEHPLAGTAADLVLTAADAAGNRSTSPPLAVVLPERRFRHPVARALDRLRRDLLSGRTEREFGALLVAGLREDKAAFDGDPVVYLGLSVAGARLRHARTPGLPPTVPPLLWDLAIRLEGGDPEVARLDMERTRRDLLEALAGGADPETLDGLTDRLRSDLDRLLRAIDRSIEAIPPGLRELARNGTVVREVDLRKLLDRLQAMMHGGDIDGARDLLSRLGTLLNGLHTQAPMAFDAQTMKRAGELLDRLETVETEQQTLIDDTFRRQPPVDDYDRNEFNLEEFDPVESVPMPDLAERQKDLARRLQDAQSSLSALTDLSDRTLDAATAAMRDAARSLETGEGRRALERQGRALEHLRNARTESMEALARMARGMGSGFLPATGSAADPFGRDDSAPLGRALTGPVGLPEAGGGSRAGRLRDEIRRRVDDPARPDRERDYLKRLLAPY